MSADRSLTHSAARVVEALVVMLGEMDVHDVRVGDLAQRAGVAIPTVYYQFKSLDDVIAEATVVLLHRFLEPFCGFRSDMQRAVSNDDHAEFEVAARGFMQLSWSAESNERIHRLAPLIAYFREIAPEDVRLRSVQAREIAAQISVLSAARDRGWIEEHEDVSAFIIVHWTCVLGQAVFFHPSFGPLTDIVFTDGVGRLCYQTSLRADIGQMSLKNSDTV